MRRLALALTFGALLVGSCECGGESGKDFRVDVPLAVGDTWYFREEDDSAAALYLDTTIAVKDTVFKGTDALALYTVHANYQRDTVLAYIRGDTYYHYSRTTGFFPESLNWQGSWYYVEFDEPKIEIAWLPLELDLGDDWVVARSSGKIRKEGESPEPVSAEVTAVFDSIQTVQILDTIYTQLHPGETLLVYENALRVRYIGHLTYKGIPIDLEIGRSWWLPGYGVVKQWTYSTDEEGRYDPLVMYLVKYTGEK